MNIELSDAELTLLRGVLDQAFRDLKEEVYKTETYTFKEQLLGQERVLEGLLAKLGRPIPSGAERA
jgi:hypothetical protein